MSDSYQAIYDAVRSRISGGNIGDAVRDIARDAFDMSFAREAIVQDIRCAAQDVAAAMTRPSVLYRPTLSADGTSWCALLGDNLQDGVAGFGDTPEKAMVAFDEAFMSDPTPAALRARQRDGG